MHEEQSVMWMLAAGTVVIGNTSVAGTILGAWSAATAFWMAVGTGIWRLFFEPRLKEMKALLASERERCDDEIGALRNRVRDLELLLLLHGPQALRQHMQAALSEKEMETRTVSGETGEK